MRNAFQIYDNNPIPLHIHHKFDTQEKQNSSIACILLNWTSILYRWIRIHDKRVMKRNDNERRREAKEEGIVLHINTKVIRNDKDNQE